MAGFIARQPNGLLCRFSTVVDCITHYNMTDEEYIQMCAERAKEEAKNVIENFIKPFEMVENSFVENNMTKEEFERILKEMELPKEQCKYTET